MKKYFPLFALLCFANVMFAQYLSKEKALEDLNYLAQSIEKYNPGLQQFTPHFAQEFDSLKKQVSNPISMFEYFQWVSRTTVLAREAHFNMGSWQDTFHSGFLENRYRYLPLKVVVIRNKLYVWDSYLLDTVLKRGDEITIINGKTVSGVIRDMLKHIPRDGNITGYPIKRLGDGFNWMYYLFIEQPDQFNIQVKKFNTDEVVKHSFPALTRKEMVANVAEKFPPKENAAESGNPVYSFESNGNQASLTLKTFNRSVVEENKIKAAKLYKSVFKELQEKDVSTLVVDLRNNFGGRNEFADEMLPYLPNIPEKGSFKTSISWEGNKKTYDFPTKSKYAFTGKIYVLVNEYTYSSAATLARYLKEYSNAIFIGNVTGTRYEGYAAGSTQTITLPNSGLKIGIPRYVYVYPESEFQKTKNQGLVPDYELNYTIEDMIGERDLCWEAVENLITGGKIRSKRPSTE